MMWSEKYRPNNFLDLIGNEESRILFVEWFTNWIKGTKMSFAGLKNAKDRAAVIRYMNENTNSPLPLQ